jgi:hypothetical protein
MKTGKMPGRTLSEFSTGQKNYTMTLQKIINSLQEFQDWRKGSDDVPMPEPKALSKTISAAIELLKRSLWHDITEKKPADGRPVLFRVTYQGKVGYQVGTFKNGKVVRETVFSSHELHTHWKLI